MCSRGHVKPGETILVHGASGGVDFSFCFIITVWISFSQMKCFFLQVGVAVCQLSRALGLRVLGTAGTPEGMKLVLNNGAHQAFNHREDDYTLKILVHPNSGTVLSQIQTHWPVDIKPVDLKKKCPCVCFPGPNVRQRCQCDRGNAVKCQPQ